VISASTSPLGRLQTGRSPSRAERVRQRPTRRELLGCLPHVCAGGIGSPIQPMPPIRSAAPRCRLCGSARDFRIHTSAATRAASGAGERSPGSPAPSLSIGGAW
jgi:hypothetical protein